MIGAYVFLSKVALRATAALLGTTDAFEDLLVLVGAPRIAPRVCAQLVALRSVFVKFGQYIGGRTDRCRPSGPPRDSSSCRTTWRRAAAATSTPPSARRLRPPHRRASSPSLRTRRSRRRRWRRCTSPACATHGAPVVVKVAARGRRLADAPRHGGGAADRQADRVDRPPLRHVPHGDAGVGGRDVQGARLPRRGRQPRGGRDQPAPRRECRRWRRRPLASTPRSASLRCRTRRASR